jgi:hypothetical protein
MTVHNPQLIRIDWWAVTEDADGKPNTWTARFGAGYLVLHSSPTGSETLVYVPDAESKFGWPDVAGQSDSWQNCSCRSCRELRERAARS